MGMKGHGTYAKLWQDVWRHPKTFRLARSIAALGYPERAAKREAVGQLHELLCWCIAESDDGQIAHLPPAEFARVVGWDDPRRAPQLLEAWKDSGFLDVVGPDDIRVHDFTDAAKELLYKRALRRPDGGQDAADSTGQRADNGRPKDGQRAPNGRPKDGQRAPSGRPSRARSATATATADLLRRILPTRLRRSARRNPKPSRRSRRSRAARPAAPLRPTETRSDRPPRPRGPPARPRPS